MAEKRGKIDLILTGLSPDNLDVANEAIRGLKREIATLDGELSRLKATEAPRIALDPKEVAREAASYLWNLKQVLDEGSIEERRKFIEYFVEGAKVNGIEGWVEVSFFENPALPVTFCMVPPTGADTKRNTECVKKTRKLRFFYMTGEVVPVG